MRDRSQLLALMSFVLALVASAALLLVPAVGIGTGVRATGRPDGTVTQEQEVTREIHYWTLLEVQGAGILVPLAMPIVITVIPIALDRTALPDRSMAWLRCCS